MCVSVFRACINKIWIEKQQMTYGSDK